jgi:IS30 family transposase
MPRFSDALDDVGADLRTFVDVATARSGVALRKTLTWDQGAETAQHAQLRIDANIEIFFCDPHSPWQRPSNENTNRLLRQYFPKGTDLSRYSREDLEAVAIALNKRPRKVLGWKTPAEALNDQLLSLQTTGVAMIG